MSAVDFSCHRHPLILKEFSIEDEEDYQEEDRVCGLCGETVNGSGYECSECKFTAHIGCADIPPSLAINKIKIHEHTLFLLPRHVSFTCNACGLYGDKSPYVCLMCSFMLHKDCINFPRVVKITRHHHRLAHTFFLGPVSNSCGVCRKRIKRQYGGYSCARCVDYAVHLRCATRKDVWDGKELEGLAEEGEELEGLLEEEEEEGDKFEVIDDNKLIRHFGHEQHNLRLQDETTNRDDDVCCGCALPIKTEAFYKCDDLCDFFLHKSCANLPRKKSTFLHVHPLTLCTDERLGPNGLSRCDACKLHFNGFRYRCLECKDDDDIEFDIRCCSVSETVWISGHKHPLEVTIPTDEEDETCNGCGLEQPKLVLSCKDCSFRLCMTCATLPTEAVYKYDEHLLSANIGREDVTSLYFCDICEKKVQVKGNFYACFECDPVLHTDCAVGSFRYMRPRLSFTLHEHEYQVILNDRTSKLRCSQCLNDCHEPLLLVSTTTTDITIRLCSSRCFTAYVSAKLSLL